MIEMGTTLHVRWTLILRAMIVLLFLVAGVSAVFLAGCSTIPLSIPEQLEAEATATTSVVKMTETALRQDRITPQQACRVSFLAKVARDAMYMALNDWSKGDLDVAQTHMEAAKVILAGLAQNVNAEALEACR